MTDLPRNEAPGAPADLAETIAGRFNVLDRQIASGWCPVECEFDAPGSPGTASEDDRWADWHLEGLAQLGSEANEVTRDGDSVVVEDGAERYRVARTGPLYGDVYEAPPGGRRAVTIEAFRRLDALRLWDVTRES